MVGISFFLLLAPSFNLDNYKESSYIFICLRLECSDDFFLLIFFYRKRIKFNYPKT